MSAEWSKGALETDFYRVTVAQIENPSDVRSGTLSEVDEKIQFQSERLEAEKSHVISLQGLLFERSASESDEYWRKEVLTNEDSKIFQTPERIRKGEKDKKKQNLEFLKNERKLP